MGVTIVRFVDGKNFHVVTTHAYNEYGVAWSPQGRRILYGRADRKGIYVIDSDRRNNHRVTHDSPPQALWGALAWSPNGSSIAYATGRTGNGDIYLIDADGHNKLRLTDSASRDSDPPGDLNSDNAHSTRPRSPARHPLGDRPLP